MRADSGHREVGDLEKPGQLTAAQPSSLLLPRLLLRAW